MPPRIYVTQLVPDAALAALRRVGEVDVYPDRDRIVDRDTLIAAVRAHDYLFCLVTNRIDAAVMDANPQLKIIANMGVGYDNIDLAAATARRIPVTNTPGVLTETTADLAFALALAVARRVVEGDRLLRAGRFHGWGPMMLMGADVYGKTLGIVGFGRIGQAVAKRARGFDMRIVYHNPAPVSHELAAGLGAEFRSLEDLLRESDFVTLHTPATPSTFHLMGPQQFQLMKPTAYLINTSRGNVVDETALLAALQAGRIAGAALDVFEREPAVQPGLAGLDNVVLTPHIGSASFETRTKMALMAAANIAAVAAGNRPPNLLNPEIYSAGA